MTPRRMKESELAALIIEWLRDQKWEVYQEVLCGGPRCDIVAVQGPIVWAIETKKTMSLALIGQAMNWIPYAHYVSVGVPGIRSRVGRSIMGKFGIGILLPEYDGVREYLRPDLRRKVTPALKKSLREEQKTYAEAGNNKSLFYSPFKKTKNSLISVVKANPGIKFSEAIDNTVYHYNSRSAALSSLRIWINQGVIGEIEIRDGKLFMKDQGSTG